MGRSRYSNKGRFVFPDLSLVFVFVALIVVIVFCTVDGNEHQMPRIDLSLSNVSLNDFYENGKDIKYGGNKAMVYSNGSKKNVVNVEIKGRGNLTWAERKKPFRLEFPDKIDLAGVGNFRKWNMLANMKDDSSLRNDLAFYVGELVGVEYLPKGGFINVTINDEDLGLFYATRAIEISSNSVDLKDDYAVLVELDNAYCTEDEIYYVDKKKNCLALKDVKNKDNSETAFKTFVNKFEMFEEAVEEEDFDAIVDVVDINSLVEYFLASEFVSNPDAFFTSFYFYMDGLDDRIHVGPLWDLDASFGNRRWSSEEVFLSPQSFLGRKEEAFIEIEDSSRIAGIPKLMFLLSEIPEFDNLVKQLYKERLFNKKDMILSYLTTHADYIRKDAIKDNEMWNKGNFDEEIKYLEWWVEERFAFFNEWYGINASLPVIVKKL